MGEEGGDEVAEEGLSVGGFAAEMAVFEVAAGHDEDWMEGRGLRGFGREARGGVQDVEKSWLLLSKEFQTLSESTLKI